MSDGERRLWRAVLEQAYADAEILALGEETGLEPFECARARRYLRADSRHEAANLELVCEFADMPADRVVLWARRRYLVEQTFDKHVECGSLAPAFSIPELVQRQKRQLGCRTPQNAASRQAAVPAQSPSKLFSY
jgi:hypothetical protein